MGVLWVYQTYESRAEKVRQLKILTQVNLETCKLYDFTKTSN
jgi:hypothetical protein